MFRSFSERRSFPERHYAVLAAAVLALAAFNLTFRLGQEMVTEWDESLYAITAWEMLRTGHWIGTTFLGTLDYYNSKPPLNVWLIALSFKAFGMNLISLRVVSVMSAWLTVAVLQIWARRAFGPIVALLASLILATSFNVLYVHAGRSANPDALYTLLVLLTVVTLWAGRDRPWRYLWLGPILASAFLLKGMAVLMPLAIVLAAAPWRGRAPRAWLPIACALPLFLTPVGAWAVARWQVDQWKFFERMFDYDFLAGTFQPLEGHNGTPFFYVALLLKDHYDWLFVGVAALLLFPVPWARVRAFGSDRRSLPALVLCWAAITILVPTLMRTKLPWYLNAFYPAFALGTAWLAGQGLSDPRARAHLGERRLTLVLAILSALIVAEGRLAWYSLHYRDVGASVQGVLLKARSELAGQRVFSDHWSAADTFVLGALIGAEPRVAAGEIAFLSDGHEGDYLLSSQPVDSVGLVTVLADGGTWLYRWQ